VEDLGVVGGFWVRVLRLLVQQLVHRISQQIVEEPALSLRDVKERVCASIEADRDRWRGDDAIVDEDGELRNDQEILDELMAAVRRSETLPQVTTALSRCIEMWISAPHGPRGQEIFLINQSSDALKS
jgi:hypothetical protein